MKGRDREREEDTKDKCRVAARCSMWLAADPITSQRNSIIKKRDCVLPPCPSREERKSTQVCFLNNLIYSQEDYRETVPTIIT
jgi:hypothetical protein